LEFKDETQHPSKFYWYEKIRGRAKAVIKNSTNAWVQRLPYLMKTKELLQTRKGL